jgi:hypothetical protein
MNIKKTDAYESKNKTNISLVNNPNGPLNQSSSLHLCHNSSFKILSIILLFYLLLSM